MIYKTGTKLIDRETGDVFFVTNSDTSLTYYIGHAKRGYAITTEVADIFDIDRLPVDEAASVLDTQEGGDHYKKLGDYQPWKVLRAWLTPEEFQGYMKGTAIAYLARERDKGGMLDVRKAAHTLQGLIELMGIKK